jgi:hypothetical protein
MARKEHPVYASKKHIFVFGIVIVAALIAIYSWQRYFRSKRAGWPSARVSLSEFRTLPIQVIEGQRAAILSTRRRRTSATWSKVSNTDYGFQSYLDRTVSSFFSSN